MSKRFPSQMQASFMTRMPDGLRDRIAEGARKNGRSMNSEIVHNLLKVFPPPTQLDQAVLASNREKVDALAKASFLANMQRPSTVVAPKKSDDPLASTEDWPHTININL